MRVRHLQTYLREQRCVRTGDISVCKGMRVGIDALYFFKSLKALNDSLSDANGSLSPAFVSTIDEQLKLMDELGLQPLFVFQGMQPKSHMLLSAQMMGFAMHDGWVAYAKGDEALSKSKFSQNVYKEFSEEIIQFLMLYLKSKGREIIRAPYFSSAQLVYFINEGLIDTVIGAPSMLLFGTPRVIICLDLSKKSFDWIELDDVLTRWGITRDQLIDCCLLAGTEHCLSYPLLAQPFSFANAIECIKQGPLIKYLYQFPNRDRLSEYVDGYCIGKTLITYPLVLTLSGEVTSLFRSDLLPSDYHKIVGCKLPKSIYYLLSEGLLSVQIPFALALGEWLDEPNYISDSIEYRDLLSDLREYHCRALGLVALKLDESFKTKQIKFPKQIFFKNSYQLKQPAKVLIPNTCSLKNWNITLSGLNKELKHQNTREISLGFCLRWHNSLGSQLINNRNDRPVNDFNVMNTILHFMLLDNLGYFTTECGITAFGRVLSNSELGMDGLLILELMKFGLFTGDILESPPDIPYSTELQLQFKNEQMKRYYTTISLISRISTLTILNVDNNIWNGKIDFDIASFNIIVKLLKRSINYITQGCLAYLLLTDTSRIVKLNDKSFDPTNSKLPFFHDTSSTFFGVVMKYIFMGNNNNNNLINDINITTDDNGYLDVDSLGINSIEHLMKIFPNCTNINNDLIKFSKFWVQLHNLLHNLAYLVQVGDVIDYFDYGTLLLANKLNKLGINTDVLNKIIN